MSVVAPHDHHDSLWNRAAAATVCGDSFCARTEWQLSCHEVFAAQRRLHVRCDSDSVVALAERHDERFGRLLEPLDGQWLFGCPLLGDGALELLAELLAELHTDSPLAVCLSGLVPAGALSGRILALWQSRGVVWGCEPTAMCSASLAGGLAGYLARRSARWRRNLRVAARRAADRGVVYERCLPHDRASAAAIYERMLAVERSSWKGRGRCGMAESPAREFYASLLQRLVPAAAGRVVFARVDACDIGFVFGGVADGVYRGQQFSHDTAWAAASIGNLLQWEQLRWLCEQGVDRYDMGPEMDYKRHWAEIRTENHTWLLQPHARVDTASA